MARRNEAISKPYTQLSLNQKSNRNTARKHDGLS